MGKQSVTVEQFSNPKKSETDREDYVYFVRTVKNRLTPPVGTYATATQVRALIDNDVEVTIVTPK